MKNFCDGYLYWCRHDPYRRLHEHASTLDPAGKHPAEKPCGSDTMTLLVRAISENDLDGLFDLAALSGGGMTTLKPDRSMLAQRIKTACASFAEQIAPPLRDYVFVMEEPVGNRLVGVCAIKATVGLDAPFYNYRLGTLVHSSTELNVFSQMDMLNLSNDLTDSAELCSLFLHPDFRSGSNGKLLSKSRLLFIAQFAHLFPSRVIAEMRGVQRDDGSSPFWDHLGRHFFKMDFKQADDLCSLGKKSFIAELMPRHPLYVAYLPPEAQEVIGRVHAQSAPARRLLQQEGMHYEGYIDIFDAGPVLQARIDTLRAVRESRGFFVENRIVPEDASERPLLVSTTSLTSFRVIVDTVSGTSTTLALGEKSRRLLGCHVGDTVHALPLDVDGNHHR